ncbi:MAG: hypothetical protein JXR14_01015 [Paracoccaceae bacterium]
MGLTHVLTVLHGAGPDRATRSCANRARSCKRPAFADVKFYSGPIDGILGEQTIGALAFWAEERMPAAYRLRYKRPAITMNLFDTMGVFTR